MWLGFAAQAVATSSKKDNERLTIADLREVIGAEARYQNANECAVFGDLACLKDPTACIPGYQGEKLLAPEVAALGIRHGYIRKFYAGPDMLKCSAKRPLLNWAVTAVPERPGVTGDRVFCVDTTGEVWVVADGKEPRIEGGRCPDPPKVQMLPLGER